MSGPLSGLFGSSVLLHSNGRWTCLGKELEVNKVKNGVQIRALIKNVVIDRKRTEVDI